MRVAVIAAVSENGVIGRDGGLPWRLSSDLRHFREVTTGKPVVMGRKTHESIGRPLPDRENIVVTRCADLAGVKVAPDFESALAYAAALIGVAGEVVAIGGEAIYREALPHADRCYLTEVHATVEGDIYFPERIQVEWREVSRVRCRAGAGDDHDYSFVVLDRVA